MDLYRYIVPSFYRYCKQSLLYKLDSHRGGSGHESIPAHFLDNLSFSIVEGQGEH